MAPLALSSVFNATPAQASILSDVDILNFALNLEYLEAEYYAKAVYGMGLAEMGVGISGTGTSGATIYPTTNKVNFADPRNLGFATEIAVDEINHVKFLRSALGNAAVAKPAINLASAFNGVAQAAGIANTFDPYASDLNFLLGSFLFEDVGVTAYLGAAAFINDKTYLGAASSILAVEAYHAATARLLLYRANYMGTTQFPAQAVNKISELRDSFDGPRDLDQGITNPDGSSNILPADGSSIAFSRSPGQILNIVYGQAGARSGLFFPNGVNGALNAGTTSF